MVALRLQHQQKGLSPKMFKALVSKGYPEFSSSRQQDAHEFLQHIITLVEVRLSKKITRDNTRLQRYFMRAEGFFVLPIIVICTIRIVLVLFLKEG